MTFDDMKYAILCDKGYLNMYFAQKGKRAYWKMIDSLEINDPQIICAHYKSYLKYEKQFNEFGELLHNYFMNDDEFRPMYEKKLANLD